MKNIPALFIKAAQAFMKTHKHQFIFAGGVAGTLATGVTGVRSGIRIEKKRREQEILKGDLTKKDILKIALPELVPVALSAGGSIGCQTANLVSFTKEVNALTAGIASLSTQIDRMKAAERDILGPEKAEEIQRKVAEEPSQRTLPLESVTGKMWFQDVWTGAEWYTTQEETVEMLYEAKQLLNWQDVSVNEMFMYLTKADSKNIYNHSGDYMGWRSGKRFEWHFGDGHLENGYPCKLLFYTEPIPLANRCFN